MSLTPPKLTTYVLGGLCGLFLLLALLQTAGIGAGYSLREAPAPEELDSGLQQALMSVDTSLPSYGEFAEVEQRPLFSADRRPQIIAPPKLPETPPPPLVPLNATLAGIVLTPTTRIALIRDNGTQQVSRIREGMPLPGELAGWRLTELSARNAVFDGGSQGAAELKLDPADAPPPAPTPVPAAAAATPGNPGNPPAANKDNPQQQQQQANDAAAREAEVRRIIEERRRQMREEAERMNRNKK